MYSFAQPHLEVVHEAIRLSIETAPELCRLCMDVAQQVRKLQLDIPYKKIDELLPLLVGQGIGRSKSDVFETKPRNGLPQGKIATILGQYSS